MGWRRYNAVARGEIQRPPGDVGRPSLAGDLARFCQCLFERYSLYSAALHVCNSAPCLILPSLIYRRVDFTVFGAQYPINQIGDCVLGPIAGLRRFDLRSIAFVQSASERDSLQHRAQREHRICGSFAGPSAASLCSVVPNATGATRQVVEFTRTIFRLSALIMPRSRVRVPLSPPKNQGSVPGTSVTFYTAEHIGNPASRDHRNTAIKNIRWGLPFQGLPRSGIQFPGYRI